MTAARDYAAIFMDCQMPVMDGFEATRQIRETEGGREVPIIAMTALSMPADRRRCLEAGMDDYLSKPIRREELTAVVDRCFPSGQSGGYLPRADEGSASLDGAGEENGVLDPARVRELRNSFTLDQLKELIDTFDTQQETCVAEIGAAIERGDRGEVSRVLTSSTEAVSAWERPSCMRAVCSWSTARRWPTTSASPR